MPRPYFNSYSHRRPPVFAPLTMRRRRLWHFTAGMAIGFSLIYLHWRWSMSLNPDAMAFSILVASAETLFAIGTALFFYDIWDEGDTAPMLPPENRRSAGLDCPSAADPRGNKERISVDIFITTYDEPCDVVAPTIMAAHALKVPQGYDLHVYLLDDGNRPDMAALASEQHIIYVSRTDNQGFKAGNLRNGLFHSEGDFVVICDADTILFPNFLHNTLGYFRDPKVAWVQTPHWFYDLPAGRTCTHILTSLWPSTPRWARAAMKRMLPKFHLGRDAFLSEPTIFFDVIQRRRNRHYASFCCGAASIHRREAIFNTALRQQAQAAAQHAKSLAISHAQALSSAQLQPYRFHVSEDLYTSIDLHADAEKRWRSIYHPDVEAKMLSPRTLEAFSTQRLKYAGGSIDLLFRDNAVLRPGMPWPHRLHYAATFYSYLSVLWAPILLLAPAYSLLTGQAPIAAYSSTFFLHFLPMLLLHEIAMLIGCKGHSLTNGRYLAIATLPLQLRAYALVLRGERPRFPPTPKTSKGAREFRFARPNLLIAAILSAVLLYGLLLWMSGYATFNLAFLLVNTFWLTWNVALLLRLPFAALVHTLGHPNPTLNINQTAPRKSQRKPVHGTV